MSIRFKIRVVELKCIREILFENLRRFKRKESKNVPQMRILVTSDLSNIGQAPSDGQS